MNGNIKRSTAVILCTLFFTACPVMAADPGGGGSTEGDSNAMTYVTIGVVVVIGGLLALDVINDSGNTDIEAEEPEFENVQTGVDWSEVFPGETSCTTLAVSVFEGEDGSESAADFIEILKELVPEDYQVYPEPVDLGGGLPIERARLAREFFEADFLIIDSGNTDYVQLQAFSLDSMVWTSPDHPGISFTGIVEDMLQAGVL